MDELSMVVRRAIAHTATQYEMSIVQFSHWLARRNPAVRKDFIGLEGVNQRHLSRTIENVIQLFTIGEESQMEFDAAKYTELANSGMSNVAIAKEMGFNSDAGMRYHAVKLGVYQKDPSGSQAKKTENANVGKVDGDGFKPMTVTIAENKPKLPPTISPAEQKLIAELAKASAEDSLRAITAEKLPVSEASNELWTKLPGGYSDEQAAKKMDELVAALRAVAERAASKRDPVALTESGTPFITIRIPFERKTPKADYLDRDTRKHRIISNMGDLKRIIDSVNEDIIDLLGAEDIERVQAYIDRHIG